MGATFVAPEQIEQALFGFPGVEDVAAVGMPKANGKDEIWLAIISQVGIDKEALRTFLLSKNPLWNITHIKLVSELRRNDMGKIVRSRVKEILTA